MKILNIRLSKWFPSDDRFSTTMARLCILREDLMFELQSAIESKNVNMTDEYGYPWRLLYFFRKMFITLEEIRGTIETLARDPDFKLFLVKQSDHFKKEFTQLKENLNLTREEIKNIRNDIGGHILQGSIEKALREMSYERLGTLQVSQYGPTKTHYKFTGELLIAMLLRNVPKEQEEAKANEIISLFTNMITYLFLRIDRLFFTYAKDRNLI